MNIFLKEFEQETRLKVLSHWKAEVKTVGTVSEIIAAIVAGPLLHPGQRRRPKRPTQQVGNSYPQDPVFSFHPTSGPNWHEPVG